jgi:hypothetical protein
MLDETRKQSDRIIDIYHSDMSDIPKEIKAMLNKVKVLRQIIKCRNNGDELTAGLLEDITRYIDEMEECIKEHLKQNNVKTVPLCRIITILNAIKDPTVTYITPTLIDEYVKEELVKNKSNGNMSQWGEVI